jgi:hypothetical protein
MRKELHPADIFFVRSLTWKGCLVRYISRWFGERRTQVNYLGVVVEPGRPDTAWVVGALKHTECFRLLRLFAGPRFEIAVFRPVGYEPGELVRLSHCIRNFVFKDYTFWGRAMHTLDRWLNGVFLFRQLTRRGNYPLHSWPVSEAFHSIGRALSEPLGQVLPRPGQADSPDHIWTYVLGHPERFRLIWQQGNMVPTLLPEEEEKTIPKAA